MTMNEEKTAYNLSDLFEDLIKKVKDIDVSTLLSTLVLLKT